MKETGCSDLWDKIIDDYCDKDEKSILSQIPQSEFEELEEKFHELLDDIEKSINKNR